MVAPVRAARGHLRSGRVNVASTLLTRRRALIVAAWFTLYYFGVLCNPIQWVLADMIMVP